MENESKKNSNKNGLIIGIIVFLVLVLVFSGFFVYKMGRNNKDDIKNNQEEVEEILPYTLEVYKQGFSYCLEQSQYCTEVALKINTKTEDTKVLGFDKKFNFILFKDGEEVKVYNKKTNKSELIAIDFNNKEYNLYPSEDKSKITGIIYKTNDDKIGFFNVDKKQKLYEGKYDVEEYNFYQLNDKYINYTDKNNHVHLLSTTEEEEKFTYENSENAGMTGFSSFGINNYIFALESCAGDCIITKLFSNDFKEIYSKTLFEEKVSFIDNKLYFSEDNNVKTINYSGNIETFKSYKDIKGIVDKYIVFVDSGKLKMENIITGKLIDVCDWDSKYFYDTYTSGYYDRIKLDLMNETNKEEGMYIVINYPSKDANGNYGIEYCYKENGEVIEYYITQEVGGRAKPVLYLYPTKTIDVKVEFQHPEYLTTTYPKYIDSWEVVAHSNGDLYDKNNNYYYALYWDEIRYNEVDFHEGFYVEKENAINFLEEKLSILGLNNKERNEFIMYWLPILESNGKSLVYFEQTKERELGNKLNITPKPDSMLRISIHIKKVKDKINIKEQKLEEFKRNGFTVVEWGGMTY